MEKSHFTNKLTPPNGEKKVLLHCCCAPCSGEIIRVMLESGIEITIFYYNPNIYPREEYLKRKDESIQYSKKIGISFVDAEYDNDEWMRIVKEYEDEPERGKRCTICFDLRLNKTAFYATQNNFKVFATTLGISRWKDLEQINISGIKAAKSYPDLIFWDYNWRKQGGSQRMHEISKCEHFYQQEYCGCIYSLKTSNKNRLSKGKEPIYKI